MKKYLFFVLLFITACSAENGITPTVTLQPPATTSVSPLPSPTQEIASPTSKPTEYSEAIEEQKVREFLLTNNGCSLPCFWGIDPGNTSLEDALVFFQPFGISQYHGRSGQNIPNQYDVALDVMSQLVLNSASLFEEDSKIIGIKVSGEGRPDEISSFWEIWTEYLPQRIINQYGFPDHIWFDTYHNPEVPNPDRPIGYSLWFFYDEKDFLLIYSGITTKAPEYRVCLGNQSDEEDFGNLSPYIELLIHRDIPLENFAFDRGIDQRVNFRSEKDVEIPIDEFRGLSDNQNGCFNTPLDFQP
jgi:hypothetical protein